MTAAAAHPPTALEKIGCPAPRIPPRLRAAFDPYELALLRPPPSLTVTQYAEQHRVLSEKESAFPGRFDCSLTPYLREPMDSLNAGHVRRVSLMFCTQHGKTLTYENLFLYILRYRPGNMMILGPDRFTAKKISDRLRAVVKAVPDLEASLTGKVRDLSTYEYRFRRMNAVFAWAGSPASMAGSPCRYAFADETGKFITGDPIGRLEKRVETFFDSFIYDCSSPSRHNSAIEKEYEAGDRRHWQLPCPHCGTFQTFAFWDETAEGREFRVHWPPEASPDTILRENLAFYVCPECGAQITNAEKNAVLAKGAWVPEAAKIDRNGRITGDPFSHHRSYHYSAAASPFPNSSFSALAYEWLTAQGDHEALRVFYEDKLALTYQETIDTGVPVDLSTLETGYAEGTLPLAEPRIRTVTAGIDIQLDQAYFVARAWNSARESWLVRVRRLDLATPADWDRLYSEIFDTPYLDPDGRVLHVSVAAIDNRYRPDEVRAFCRRNPGRLKPIFGDAGGARIRRTQHEKTIKGKARKKAVDSWTVNSNSWKSTLAFLQSEKNNVGWHLFRGVPAFYLDQLSAEHLVKTRSGAHELHVWELKSTHRANHCLDAEMLALVAASLQGVYSDRPLRPGTPAAPTNPAAALEKIGRKPVDPARRPDSRLSRIQPRDRRRKIDR